MSTGTERGTGEDSGSTMADAILKPADAPLFAVKKSTRIVSGPDVIAKKPLRLPQNMESELPTGLPTTEAVTGFWRRVV